MPDDLMTWESLGWNESVAQSFAGLNAKGLELARVAVEDKHNYLILTPQGELSAQIAGKVLYHVKSEADLPKVGDWVAVAIFPNEGKGIIHHVLPRKTKLSRKASGRETKEQVLATNIDIAFVVQALDQSFNPRLLERHLAMVNESGARPVVILNKADLCNDLDARMARTRQSAGDAPIIVVSAATGEGMDCTQEFIRSGVSIVFIGSSGVGKSSLINRLYGEDIQATMEVRANDAKGRHTTSWREMIMLPQGGLVIDTPGMREFQMWTAGEDLQAAFADVDAIAVGCHFRECSHTKEERCAVLGAVASGQLTQERYEHYVKLKRELDFLGHAQHEYAQRERKRQTKMAQNAFYKLKKNSLEP